MSTFGAALRKEWMEQRRTHRLLISVVVLVFFGLLSPLTARYTPDLIKLLPNGAAMAQLIPPPTIKDAFGQYLKNVSQFGIVLALLLTMGAVAGEKERGTAAMMLVKPLPRGAFLGAKFLAIGGTFSMGLTAAAVAGYYYTTLLFEAPDPLRWVALNGLVFGYLMVPVAVTLFFSVLAKSQAAAGGMAFGTLALLAVLGAIPDLGAYLPGQLLGWAGAVMTGAAPAHWPALGVSLGIIASGLAGGWWLLERQEL